MTKPKAMKNYQIEFILKTLEGNSFKLNQQIISVEASNKKDALKVATKKLYIPRNFIKIDYKQFI
jgi:hypothetical protein